MSRDRDEERKWCGWGYKDSYFWMDDNADIHFKSDRYEIGGRTFPNLGLWMRKTIGSRVFAYDKGKDRLNEKSIPSPILNETFMQWLTENKIEHSTDGPKRVNRSHGHSLEDIVRLRLGECYKRIPDVIVWPKDHDEVVKIVKMAHDTNTVIIPIGGGTSVSDALTCPQNEKRCIVSLDLCKLDKILWIDEKNMLARAQCGIIGIDLEKQLNSKGFTLGHEPDSIEFSTLGGWVATRASGIKKNKYGNIEDLVVHVTLVTPSGVIQKLSNSPRVSAGPDVHHFILGSEGTLGVVTEVTFKICYIPECTKFGSIVFPTFENGVKAMREIARQKPYPASIRLMDNVQFRSGQTLKPIGSKVKQFIEALKILYVTKVKNFDLDEISPAIFILEGSKDEVAFQEKRLYEIAANFGGLPAGAENGRYGYVLTNVITYLRDIGLNYFTVGESFETSIVWDKVMELCQNVRKVCLSEAKRLGVKFPPVLSARVTQLYDNGPCVYFYFGFNYRNMEDDDCVNQPRLIEKALHVYEQIENSARNEILRCGGSISHHHGVGKIRQKFMKETVSEAGLSALIAVKEKLDPKNIFACGNAYAVPTAKL